MKYTYKLVLLRFDHAVEKLVSTGGGRRSFSLLVPSRKICVQSKWNARHLLVV
jgi:hypothetical protein